MLKNIINIAKDQLKDELRIETKFDKDYFELVTYTYIHDELVSQVSVPLDDLYDAFKERLHADWYPDE